MKQMIVGNWNFMRNFKLAIGIDSVAQSVFSEAWLVGVPTVFHGHGYPEFGQLWSRRLLYQPENKFISSKRDNL